MSSYFKAVSAGALIVLVTLVWVPPVVGQGEPGARGQGAQAGRGRGGAPPPPVPPSPQAGHPSGKLVIWGDLADFTRPGPVLRCYATSRFKRGQRAGFRMTAVDGGSGEVENTAEMTIHLSYKGSTIDIPMRWRGNMPFPAQEYLHAPVEMWTGVWEVPEDAPIGTLTYTVTATDRFGRTATFNPFPNHLSQFAVVE
jgi:hypothetical protein